MVEFLADRRPEKKKKASTTTGAPIFAPHLFRSFVAFAWFIQKIMHSSIKGLAKLIEKKNMRTVCALDERTGCSPVHRWRVLAFHRLQLLSCKQQHEKKSTNATHTTADYESGVVWFCFIHLLWSLGL